MNKPGKPRKPANLQSPQSEEWVSTDLLIQSDNYEVWLSHEPDGEVVYHVELDTITLHFFKEEWLEFAALIHHATEEEKDRKRDTK
jgi:hypothetical protein